MRFMTITITRFTRRCWPFFYYEGTSVHSLKFMSICSIIYQSSIHQTRATFLWQLLLSVLSYLEHTMCNIETSLTRCYCGFVFKTGVHAEALYMCKGISFRNKRRRTESTAGVLPIVIGSSKSPAAISRVIYVSWRSLTHQETWTALFAITAVIQGESEKIYPMNILQIFYQWLGIFFSKFYKLSISTFKFQILIN